MITEPLGVDLPAPWRAVRAAVLAEKRELNQTIFERVWQVYIDDYAGKKNTPEHAISEYLREEFLLVVDDGGGATGTASRGLQTYRAAVTEDPVFTKWFKEACTSQTGPVLLAARWLCHLIGLRHRTVEIFIDPPHLEGHTLVQVRGLDKFEAPGAFDIPCAGHVSEVDSAEEALRKELVEELNLSLDDFEAVNLLGEYNSYTGDGALAPLNNEYRFLYRARLKSSAIRGIRFMDGEVAGLAVFSVPELRALVKRFPERIASGLSDAMRFYS